MPKTLEPRSVAYVRITLEPVYIYSIEGDIAHCRRGVVAQSGNFYKNEDFTLGELMAEEPHRGGFEELFKEQEGDIVVTSGPQTDSLLQ